MKKITAIVVSMALLLSLSACGSQQSDTPASSAASETSASAATQESTTAAEASEEPSSAETEGTEAAETKFGEAEAAGGKTLVVYYSATGNTEEAANVIAQATNGDTFELEPAEAYSSADLNWSDDGSRVVYEHDNPEAREVALVADTVPDWESYETVFIGYPIWWGIAAWPVDGFIKANDFTGKTVIPFCTSSSSGLGESGELLAELAGTGNWLEGIRFSSGASEETIQEWVESLGL